MSSLGVQIWGVIRKGKKVIIKRKRWEDFNRTQTSM